MRPPVVGHVEVGVVGVVGVLQSEEQPPLVRDRAIDVTHDGAPEVAALLLNQLDDLHGRGLVATRMDHQRRARLTLGLHGGVHDLLLVLRPRPRVADLADELGADARVAHADGDLADDLAEDRVLAPHVHVGGMRGRHVIAGAHDDVAAGGPRDPRQREGIAREAHARGSRWSGR